MAQAHASILKRGVFSNDRSNPRVPKINSRNNRGKDRLQVVESVTGRTRDANGKPVALTMAQGQSSDYFDLHQQSSCHSSQRVSNRPRSPRMTIGLCVVSATVEKKAGQGRLRGRLGAVSISGAFGATTSVDPFSRDASDKETVPRRPGTPGIAIGVRGRGCDGEGPTGMRNSLRGRFGAL